MTDERQPRTSVTLPLIVRLGVGLGLLSVVLAPLGLVAVVFIAPDPEAALRSVGPVVNGVVAAVALVGAVVLVVSLRRMDAALVDGDGPITRRTALTIWTLVFAMALAMAGGFVYSTAEAGRLARVESDGVRVMAHDAEVRVVSASKVMVRAVVDYHDGPRQVQLVYDQNPHPDSSRPGWMPAPVPYDDTFSVLYDPDDPDFLVAEIDIADTGLGVVAAELGRAAAVSALWGAPWFVAWIVMVLRAARRRADGAPA